ncbi:HotDog domain-containing protein [Xylariaceae sp. FL0594]|nr:HotDog domain-containing protein [Xylariaceae sp. FL0594]
MSFFESIPWCAAMLQKPGVVTFTPMARMAADASGNRASRDQLFRTTLGAENAIPNYIGLYQTPFSDPARLTLLPTLASHSPEDSGQPSKLLIDTVSLLIDLQPGVNGYTGTTHGGLIAALLDEAMGCLLFFNGQVQRDMRERGLSVPSSVVYLSNEDPIFTASVAVKYIRPITTPQVVVAAATLKRIEKGRKFFLGYDIRGDDGVVFASGEGLWISARREKL